MELSGLSPWLSKALVVGPFKEEEEGIGITSKVVKVEGEDPATTSSLRGGQGEVARWRSVTWVRVPWSSFKETSGP